MVIKYNVTGAERKRLVAALSNLMGVKAKYLGMPSMAYEVSDFIIDKNGNLELSDKANRTEIERVARHLASEGFIAEEEISATEGKQTADSEEFGLTVSMPRSNFSEGALENLQALVEAKGELIRHALGVEELPIEISEDEVSFPWFEELPTPEEIKAYTHFISALSEMAINQKRITVKEKEVENEKYAFRCFLLRLGFIGKEYKDERKILLRNLTGSAAFKEGVKNEDNQ
ncbi:virulence protein [Listeria monocytogenes]|uniref:virulence protein n=1 Tax=Listeria monocytogenes TaxID=1639 RepID=UPI0011CA2C73|nr:virulence protein [Listeria monocytogenes]EIV7423953.1 virulence protein [Listeria monocytogenes]EIV7426182.1 virulence protein [Listeria monocytogenes]EKO7300039.1 virulence protein [Listeria monocytogenes]EKO7371353.1 virulence protein [Listeria monocytogenes]EKO7371733.1 virulence protein [Listeria monocytogenes]